LQTNVALTHALLDQAVLFNNSRAVGIVMMTTLTTTIDDDDNNNNNNNYYY